MSTKPERDTVLVTGGLGFIGSAFIRRLMETTDCKVVNVDCGTYAAVGGTRLTDMPHKRYVHDTADLQNPESLRNIVVIHKPNLFVHLAAESHVDRSIDGALPFVRTNVEGTLNLLEAALFAYNQHKIRDAESSTEANRFFFLQVSTDEVYGSLQKDRCSSSREGDPLAPGNPYAATKAAAEHLVMAYANTFGLPVAITRGSNTYGKYQHPEKFIPSVTLAALEGLPIPVYGDGCQERAWLHVGDHVEGLFLVLTRGRAGRVYNVGGDRLWRNLSVAEHICQYVDEILKDNGNRKRLITHVRDRPGHDFCYALGTTRMRQELGWYPFTELISQAQHCAGLYHTVHWCIENRDWLKSAGEIKRLGLRGTQNVGPGNNLGGRKRDTAASSDTGGQQAAAASVRQADDLLPVDVADGGGDQGCPGDHDPAGQ